MSDAGFRRSRRRLLSLGLRGLGGVLGGGFLLSLAACGREGRGTAVVAGTADACSDISALGSSESSMRSALRYVELSPYGEAKNCANCHFFSMASAEGCGRCEPVKGPISPTGHCTIWTARG